MPESWPINEIHFDEAPAVETVPGPHSRRLIEKQERIETSAVRYAKDIPIAFEEGRGATLRDVDGNIYLDFFAGVGVVNVGHSNPYVVEGANDQLATLTQTLDFPTELRLELVEKLEAIAPGELPNNSRVLFGGPTGSNAIEGSIKLARYNTGGDGLIAFRGAFHGSTIGAMGVTSKHSTKGDYTPFLPNAIHLPYPYPGNNGRDPEEAMERSLEEVEEIINDPASGFSNPAGVWVEAIQGEGGVVVPPDEFLPRLKSLLEPHNIPLIVDEVQTGFGRTGKWFASEWSGVTPDAVTFGKAAGGIGLPLSGVIYHEHLDTWEPGGHTGTFRGHLAGMRAGLRAIEYIEAHDLLTHARSLGEYIRMRLTEAGDSSPLIERVRGRGLFVGVEFHDGESVAASEIVKSLQRYCYENGVLVWTAGRRGQCLRLLPPLVMTKVQAERGLDVIIAGVDELTSTYAE